MEINLLTISVILRIFVADVESVEVGLTAVDGVRLVLELMLVAIDETGKLEVEDVVVMFTVVDLNFVVGAVVELAVVLVGKTVMVVVVVDLEEFDRTDVFAAVVK